MKTAYNQSTPIEYLWLQIEDCITYAGAANVPFFPQQVVNVAYNLLFKTGLFKDELKE